MDTTGHDGRFAPSPSGPLHLGNLRTALVAWLAARSHGARFLLRIDDLDPDRSRSEHEQSQLRDLAALGIDWDGPVVRQSARLDRYDELLLRLRERELAYPCFCTRAEVLAAATAPHANGVEAPYPGTCTHLARGAAQARVDAGEPHCVRVRAGGATTAFDDLLLGALSTVVDDFVVRRRDGVAAYNLATAADESDLAIDEVVRGADLAPTTPRQVWLARQLDLHVPRFAHVPLVVGADGARLAKRHGATTLDELATLGHAPRHVLAGLARSIGHELDAAAAATTAADLLPAFDLLTVAAADARVDLDAAGLGSDRSL